MASGAKKVNLLHPSFLILVLGAAGLGFGFGAWIAGGFDSGDAIVTVIGGVVFLVGAAWCWQRRTAGQRQPGA